MGHAVVTLASAPTETYMRAMEDAVQALLALKLWVVGLWLFFVFVVERLRPRARPRRDEGLLGWRRLGRNAGLWLANVGLSPLIVVPVTYLAATNSLGWRDALAWPDWWSDWYTLLIDLVLLDLFIYWWHRANHEIPFLWRFHHVHHLDEFLDSTSAVRFHFGEVVLSALVRALFIILLDTPLAAALLFETLLLAAAIFHHSNVALPRWFERPLSMVIITPSIHWVHHHAIRRDTDSNYGTLFSFWDRMFASRSRTERTPDMPIGVEHRHDESLPSLFVAPFRERN